MKVGLLFVAYGSASFKGTSALRSVQEKAAQRFGLPVRWAYTSETMRHRLACSKTKSDSVYKALSRMRFERFTHVAVQSLHIIPGREYDAVGSDCAHAAAQLGMHIQTGPPLLFSSEDQEASIKPVAELMIRHIPASRASDEPVVYMAHGTRNECAALYACLAGIVHAMDPLVFVAAMIRNNADVPATGDPAVPDDDLEALLPLLRSCTPTGRQVWLLPMLSLVGSHAVKDMAGDHDTSWKKRIMEAGLPCTAELKGLADDPSFVSLWLDRVDASLKKLYAPT